MFFTPPLTEQEIVNVNVQVLAFVGDAVHTLFVRNKVAQHIGVKSGELHKRANEFVKASAQSGAVNKLEEIFTPEELNIYKRARNYKTQLKAKNSSIVDYRRATGFEAVLGYLYLTGKSQRLTELLNLSATNIENN